MNGFFQSLLSIFSGILLSLAIANPLFSEGFAPLAFIALVPLYLSLCAAKNYGDAMRSTAIQALTVHLLSSYHLMFFRDFAIFTLGASALGTAGVASLFGALFFFPLSPASRSFYPATLYTPPLSPSSPRFSILHSPRSAILYSFHPASSEYSLPSSCFLLSRIPYPLFFACVYTLYDYFKAEGIGFLAYPWGTIPSAVTSFHLLTQTADLAGVWGLSFMFSLFSAVIGEGILLIPLQGVCPFSITYRFLCVFRLCIALILSSAIYGTVQWGKEIEIVKVLTAIIVQQNSDPWTTNEEENILESERLTEAAFDTLQSEGRNADVVIWSEGVLSRAFPNGYGRYFFYPKEKPLVDFIAQIKVPFIIGGCAIEESAPPSIRLKDGEETASSPSPVSPPPSPNHHNAALFFDASGRYKGFYAKLHLVPFAEVIPGIEYEWVRRFMKSVVGFSSGWAAGKKYTYFDLTGRSLDGTIEVISSLSNSDKRLFLDKTDGGHFYTEGDNKVTVRVSVPICFDDAFATVCRPLFLNGSEAFFNITDDSWSLTESAERQHLALARYRAIEYQTTLLRATNSGISAVIDAKGRTLQELPLFKATAKAVEVPIYPRVMTVYALLGDWFPFLLSIIAAICALEVSIKSMR